MPRHGSSAKSRTLSRRFVRPCTSRKPTCAASIDVARANNVFQSLAIAIGTFMTDYDIILSPTLAAPPLELGVLDLMPDDFAKWGATIAAFTPWSGQAG